MLSDGKECFYAFKVYYFHSVINQSEGFLKRPKSREPRNVNFGVKEMLQMVFIVTFMMAKYGKIS